MSRTVRRKALNNFVYALAGLDDDIRPYTNREQKRIFSEYVFDYEYPGEPVPEDPEYEGWDRLEVREDAPWHSRYRYPRHPV